MLPYLGCSPVCTKSVTVLLLSSEGEGFRSTEKLKQFISMKLVGENWSVRDPERTTNKSRSTSEVL